MILRALAIAALLAGCGFNESPRRCTKSTQCPNNRLCVWSLSDGCGGMGHCEDTPECFPVPMARFQGCGCDGKAVFDLTSKQATNTRDDVCGWDGPVVSTSPCK